MKVPHTVPKLILRAYTRDCSSSRDDSAHSVRKEFYSEKLQPSRLSQQCLNLIIKDYTFFTTLTDETNRQGVEKYEKKYEKFQIQLIEYRRKRQNYEKKILDIQLKKAQRARRLRAKQALNQFDGDDDDEEDKIGGFGGFSGGLSRFKTLSVRQLQVLHLPKEPTPVEEFTPILPILDRLSDADRVEVVDDLNIKEIPLPVAIRTIRDSFYWERAARERWPEDYDDTDEHGGSWQQTYMEKHLCDALERFHPFNDDDRILLEQVELVSSNVQQLTLINLIPCCFGIESASKIFKPFIPDEELTGEDEGFAQAGYLRQAEDIQNLQCEENTGQEVDELKKIRDNSHFDLSFILGHLPFLTKVSLIYELQEIGMEWEAKYFDFTLKDVENLAKALSLAPTIQHFELNRSRMTGEQCRLLVRDGLKKMPNLQILNFSYNNIGDEGATAIAELLQVNKIHTLSLARNHIMNNGVKALAKTVTTNLHLTFLDLRLNLIGDLGCQELGHALLKNKSLITLKLAANRITNESCHVMSTILQKNNTLKQLDLSCNDFDERGGASLVEGIIKNNQILKLNIRLSNTGLKTEQFVERHLKKNQSLLSFSILDRDYVSPS